MSSVVTPTLGAQVLTAFVTAVEAFGVPRATFQDQLQLDDSALLGSKSRISFELMAVYFERAVAASKDPALALHWAERLQVGAFGPVSHLLTSTGTLRKGFELIAHFAPLFCDVPIFDVIERGDEMVIQLADWKFTSPMAERFTAEMVLAGMLKMVRGSFDSLAMPTLATFSYPAPAYRAEYERIFGCAILFAQPSTALVFERALLDRPSPHLDRETHMALRVVAEQRLSRVSQRVSYTARLRTHLSERLPARVSMNAAADELGLSERSLRRHLADEGTSYREIENAVLESSAKHFLCDQRMTIQETASAMGFADVATFHRAFKAWTGLTPTEFRKRH